MAEKSADSIVVRIFSVSIPLNCDKDSTRLDRSAACQSRKKEAGKCSKRVIKAVCIVYSSLSLTRNTTILRVTCTIDSPTAALNSSTATGNSCDVVPEGITSLNTIFVT